MRQNEISLKPAREKVIKRYSFYILILFYTVGLLGMLLSNSDSFLQFSPFTLLLSLVLLFICQRDGKKSFALFFIFSWCIGFLVEVAGVSSGILFGEYYYGDSLGLKLLEVPLIIGVNWFLLAMGAGYLSSRMFNNGIIQVLLGAGLMVFTDVFIEPVAPLLDYWYWEGGKAPWQNYLSWYVVSVVLQLLFQVVMKGKTNTLAISYYIVVTVFFIILRLFL